MVLLIVSSAGFSVDSLHQVLMLHCFDDLVERSHDISLDDRTLVLVLEDVV